MNHENLQSIFKQYIDNFDLINNRDHDENYKWEIAAHFQKFDVSVKNIVDTLTQLWKISDNFIDSTKQLPFHALVEYAKREPQRVCEMFNKLFEDEHMELAEKERRIQAFINECEELRLKYFPYSHLYVNTLRSVMQYLFLRYPDSNYCYKASQAKKFADCIGFYEDWGPMTDFNLDVYYKMCDQLVEEIKKDEALLATHRSRYEHTKRSLHPDTNLHILAFDIIYTSQAYDFYVNTTFNPINAQARKLHAEQVAKAKEKAALAEAATQKSLVLAEAQSCFSNIFKAGTAITHRKHGEGIIESHFFSEGVLMAKVFFPLLNQTKSLSLLQSAANHALCCDCPALDLYIEQYSSVAFHEADIAHHLEQTTRMLEPYLEYLD